MLDEVMAEGDSVLVYSQFTEIDSQLEKLLKTHLHHNTYYLHGGTSRGRRETMIEEKKPPGIAPAESFFTPRVREKNKGTVWLHAPGLSQ